MSDDDRIWTNAMVLAERDKEIDALEQKLARADARIAELEAVLLRMFGLLTEARESVTLERMGLLLPPRASQDEITRLSGLIQRIDGELKSMILAAARAGGGESGDAG